MKSLLLALALVAGATETKVYTWTDDDGVVHYTTQPPEDKRDSANEVVVKVRQGSRETQADAEGGADGAPGEAPEAQADEGPSLAELRKRRKETRQRNCEQGRLLVDGLKTAGRVRIVLQDGTEKWYIGEERDAELAKARRMVAEFC